MKKILLALVLILTTSFAYGQESKGILYKATKGEKVIYLLGDIDISTKEMGTLDNTIIDAYNESEVLVMKSNPNDPDESMPIDEAIAKLGMYRFGTIENYVSDDLIALIKERYKELNFYPPNFSKIKLWVHCGFIIMGQAEIMYPEGDKGVLGYMMKNLGNKPIIGIFKPNEDFEDVMNVSDELARYGLSIPLETLISNKEKQINSWKIGDENALKETFFDEPEEDEEYEKLSTKIESLLDTKLKGYKKIFVLIKAYNFIKDDKILFRKLNDMGYKVERVN